MTYYDKHIPKNKQHHLKASEMRDLNQEGELLGITSVASIVSAFLLAVFIIAVFLWSSKFTIFLASVFFLLTLLLSGVAYFQANNFKKSLKEVNNRLDGLDN